MDLTEEELAAAKAYMRVDTEEDDAVVTACVLSAREYLLRAGVRMPAALSARRVLYDLMCHVLALEAYDRRMLSITGTSVSQNPVMRSMLTQLKLTEPPAPDGEG